LPALRLRYRPVTLSVWRQHVWSRSYVPGLPLGRCTDGAHLGAARVSVLSCGAVACLACLHLFTAKTHSGFIPVADWSKTGVSSETWIIWILWNRSTKSLYFMLTQPDTAYQENLWLSLSLSLCHITFLSGYICSDTLSLTYITLHTYIHVLYCSFTSQLLSAFKLHLHDRLRAYTNVSEVWYYHSVNIKGREGIAQAVWQYI